jgi:hypothetical protein
MRATTPADSLPVPPPPSVDSQCSPEEIPMSAQSPSIPVPSLADAVTRVCQTLRDAEGEVQLDTSQLALHDKKASLAFRRVPDEAITIAIDVATRYPDRFPHFDVAGARYAVAYHQTVAPVIQACRAFVMRIEESVFKRKVKAGQETLAVYASMKSLARFSEGESMLPEIQRMKLLVRPYAPSRKGAKANKGSKTSKTSETSKNGAAPKETGTAPVSSEDSAPVAEVVPPAPVRSILNGSPAEAHPAS